jgi:hypothetical protein
MHTDEYEISLNRECNHCQSVISRLQKALQKRQKLYGQTYDDVLAARKQGRIEISDRELVNWKEDSEALPVWEQRLKEYRDVLAVMRISALTD